MCDTITKRVAMELSARSPPISSWWLGLIQYQEALFTMNRLRDKLLKNEIDDHLLFLEHPPVITMGRQKALSDLKISVDEIREKGIEVVETDRGGRLTYHGPGQLVIYFILNLARRGLSIRDLVWKAEEGLRLILNDYGINAVRDCRNPGLWVGSNKIASIGLHIHKNVSTHGVALNVNGDLEPFSYMIPCGVPGAGVTSVKDQIGSTPEVREMSYQLGRVYSTVLASSINWMT